MITAYVLVCTELGGHEDAIRGIKELPSVGVVERIRGNFDLMVHFAGSLSQLEGTVKGITKIPAITAVLTCVRMPYSARLGTASARQERQDTLAPAS